MGWEGGRESCEFKRPGNFPGAFFRKCLSAIAIPRAKYAFVFEFSFADRDAFELFETTIALNKVESFLLGLNY